MGSYFFKILFAMLLCLLHGQVSILGFNSPSHVKCIESERQALLNFKQGLIDDYGRLSTWSDDENNRDCCKWKGIQCNNETGHVHVLDLRCPDDTQYLTGPINITSLIHLQNIQYLDLSNNDFPGSHIPKFIGSLTNLRYLNLSYSIFGGSIPSDLGKLTRLHYLDLSRNDYLHGKIPSQLGKLSQLRHLDLNENSLNGEIPNQLGNLSQLSYLDLNENSLNGEIPYQLGNLSQLRYLDLQWNPLNGTIPSQLGKLTSLRCLRLNGRHLKMDDAKWLTSLSSLTILDLTKFPNLRSCRECIQIISDIPNLRELRLAGCQLSDDNISSLFHSHSNLSVLHLYDNMLTSSTFQLLSNYTLNLQELYLSGNNIVLSSPHYPQFPSLVTLDLSRNNISSSTFQGNFNFSSKLRELYLNDCGLTDKSLLVPSASIKSSSSSLVTLDLSFNLLKSSAIFHWLFNFTTSLHSLDLFDNLLEGPIPDGFGKVMNFLERLQLASNNLKGEIPDSLRNICTLQGLFLSNNNLSGEVSSFVQNSSWCNRHVFQNLDLTSNRITGMIPNLSNFTSLRELDLSYNQLTGEIPKSIGLLHELESLSLGGNHLEGIITEPHLRNLSKLVNLDLTDNSLSLKFGTTWVPPFQLSYLRLRSCKLGTSFPSWLQTQSLLRELDISDAGIDDFVPEWFWNKLQSISRMNMSYNNLKGTIPNLPIKFADSFIILKSNQLEGEIPTFLSQADVLDLSKNKISKLNTFLCGKSATIKVGLLDLSNNKIMGELPDCWEHLKSSLEFLDLSNNRLSGQIPQSIGTLVNLQALVLRNNSLTGGLPFPLRNCTSLVIFDVGTNLLSGRIPSWIGESLQQLQILSLRVNHFIGIVPVRLCYLKQLHLLDLSRNHLTGGIPTCLRNFTEMTEQSIITNTSRGFYDSTALLTWKGKEQVFLNPEIFLKSIDLSSNDLTGEISREVGYLLGLVSLNLARNNLHGEIPSEIGNLNQLDFLDLSRNHLSGRIPSTLSKIDGLGMLDLSNNDLSGRIPWEGHLETFDGSSFEGNVGLCGKQLNKTCPGDVTTVQPQGKGVDGEEESSVFYEGLYMSLGLGFFTGFWSLLGSILVWQRWRISYMRLLNRLTDYILVTVEVNVSKG